MSPADVSKSAQKTAKRKFGEQDGGHCNTSTAAEEAGKRPRTIGPSLPSLPIEETASDNDSDSESSGDSDIGPSLPPGDNVQLGVVGPSRDIGNPADDYAINRQATSKPSAPVSSRNKRDEWMLAPPDDADWTSRVDPTKLRNRKFNTGRSTRDPRPSGNAIATPWTETPEQKMRRLENEVMGIQPPISGASKEPASDKIMEKRLQSYNVGHQLCSYTLCTDEAIG